MLFGLIPDDTFDLGIGDAISNAFSPLKEAISGFTSGISSAINENITNSSWYAKIVSLTTMVSGWVASAFMGMLGMFEAGMGKLADGLGIAKDETLPKIGASIANRFQNNPIAKAVGEAVSETQSNTGRVLNAAGNAISGFFGSIFSAIIPGANAAESGETSEKNISTAKQAAKSAFTMARDASYQKLLDEVIAKDFPDAQLTPDQKKQLLAKLKADTNFVKTYTSAEAQAWSGTNEAGSEFYEYGAYKAVRDQDTDGSKFKPGSAPTGQTKTSALTQVKTLITAEIGNIQGERLFNQISEPVRTAFNEKQATDFKKALSDGRITPKEYENFMQMSDASKTAFANAMKAQGNPNSAVSGDLGTVIDYDFITKDGRTDFVAKVDNQLITGGGAVPLATGITYNPGYTPSAPAPVVASAASQEPKTTPGVN